MQIIKFYKFEKSKKIPDLMWLLFFTKSEFPKTASDTTLPMDVVATNVQNIISFGRFVVDPEFCKQTDRF